MRLIDADALMRRFMDKPPEYYHASYIVGEINTAPTIEARKTGKWIDDNCSVCGQYVYHGDARNYCPNCGARMDLEERDELREL